MNLISFLWIASLAGSFLSLQSFLKTVESVQTSFSIRVGSAGSIISSPFLSNQPPLAMSFAAAGWHRSTAMASAHSRLKQTVEDAIDPVQGLLGLFVRWTELGKPLISHPQVTVVRSISSPATSNLAPSVALLTAISSCDVLKPIQAVSQTTGDRSMFQIRVNNHLIAELPNQAQADAIANQLRQTFQSEGFDPTALQPAVVDDQPAAKVGETVLFTVDSSLASALERNAELLAIAWVNELRIALDLEPFTLVEAQSLMYDLTRTETTLEGSASWYGPRFHGRLTAAGETFDQNAMTAAHPSLPFNTYLKVTNLSNGKSVVVRINDRGPYVGQRSLDLSREAAQCLNSDRLGVVPYRAVVLQSDIIDVGNGVDQPAVVQNRPEQRMMASR
jgi:Lytic transglycolase